MGNDYLKLSILDLVSAYSNLLCISLNAFHAAEVWKGSPTFRIIINQFFLAKVLFFLLRQGHFMILFHNTCHTENKVFR